jgi:hypothetical protein
MERRYKDKHPDGVQSTQFSEHYNRWNKQHPEQAYKSCMGVLSLAKKVGNERLTNACARALDYEIYNYKIVQSILEKGFDKIKQDLDVQQELPFHNNIRGKKYYK